MVRWRLRTRLEGSPPSMGTPEVSVKCATNGAKSRAESGCCSVGENLVENKENPSHPNQPKAPRGIRKGLWKTKVAAGRWNAVGENDCDNVIMSTFCA